MSLFLRDDVFFLQTQLLANQEGFASRISIGQRAFLVALAFRKAVRYQLIAAAVNSLDVLAICCF